MCIYTSQMGETDLLYCACLHVQGRMASQMKILKKNCTGSCDIAQSRVLNNDILLYLNIQFYIAVYAMVQDVVDMLSCTMKSLLKKRKLR